MYKTALKCILHYFVKIIKPKETSSAFQNLLKNINSVEKNIPYHNIFIIMFNE